MCRGDNDDSITAVEPGRSTRLIITLMQAQRRLVLAFFLPRIDVQPHS